MNRCIFCNITFTKSSIEHIVPESLGNIYYTLQENVVCSKCNNEFSEFESKALRKSQLAFIRIKNGVRTKKGKPSTLEIGNIKAIGDESFKKDYIKLFGLEEKDISNLDPVTGSFQVTMSDFDKSEMAASKMLLKIGYESIYKSN